MASSQPGDPTEPSSAREPDSSTEPSSSPLSDPPSERDSSSESVRRRPGARLGGRGGRVVAAVRWVCHAGAECAAGREPAAAASFREVLGVLPRGWTFAVPMMTILLFHEFGHYIAARLHRVPASLPYFIP